jgi:acyl-[acyl-carrier-protein]-phospholipid O-acyltransferase / long-chain-fatty-acid--[acyl-carrier-protein] ligase
MALPALLKAQRFLPLFLTQFLGAFNDNVLKNALVMLITYKLAEQTDVNPQMLVTLAAALFILPYLLFSATAGQLADKIDRARLARYTKLTEIVLMGAAAIGFAMGWIYFLLFILFCMGTQSTFFGPIKYALLPQHLPKQELIAANAYIEAGTFLAILAGTIFGGILIMSEAGTYLISLALMGCALLGYMTSRYIPPASPPMPSLKINWNMPQETLRMIASDRKHPRVFSCIMGISWFWLVGATFLSQFPALDKDVMRGDETVVTLLLTVFSLGIGLGSLACNWLLKGQVSSRYVFPALIGITLFTLDVCWVVGRETIHSGALMGVWEFLVVAVHWRVLFDLLMVAVCGGVFIVPLYAILQHDSDPNCRARTIASNNVMNAVFMVIAAMGTMWMLSASITIPQVFFVLGIINVLAALYLRRVLK